VAIIFIITMVAGLITISILVHKLVKNLKLMKDHVQNYVNQSIEQLRRDTNQNIEELERDLESSIDSRLNKLENKWEVRLSRK